MLFDSSLLKIEICGMLYVLGFTFMILPWILKISRYVQKSKLEFALAFGKKECIKKRHWMCHEKTCNIKHDIKKDKQTIKDK